MQLVEIKNKYIYNENPVFKLNDFLGDQIDVYQL